MSSPDRADVAAVVTEAVNRAAEYWGGPHDIEVVVFAELTVADIQITRGQFQEMVEAKIAIDWADNHADLSQWDLGDACDWTTRAEFIREQREGWHDAILKTVVNRTRTARAARDADALPVAA
jgi:hypothetical protein